MAEPIGTNENYTKPTALELRTNFREAPNVKFRYDYTIKI